MKRLKLTLRGYDSDTVIEVKVNEAVTIALKEIALRTEEASVAAGSGPLLMVQEELE